MNAIDSESHAISSIAHINLVGRVWRRKRSFALNAIKNWYSGGTTILYSKYVRKLRTAISMNTMTAKM